MELRFIGADHEVTGSCHYLQVGGKHILIDVGMEQGRDVFENQPLPVPASSIDFVFLTHAHIDHSGMLPKICHDGFRGGVICTGATRALCEIMLRDSAHIQAQETEWRSKKVKKSAEEKEYEPIYTMEDVMTVMKQFSTYPYGKIFTLCEGVKFRFTDIGHLLGSCSIELWLTEGGVTRKIVFSGDIGNNDQPLLRDPALTEEAEYVVMESTYGDRYHEKEKIDPVEAGSHPNIKITYLYSSTTIVEEPEIMMLLLSQLILTGLPIIATGIPSTLKNEEPSEMTGT